MIQSLHIIKRFAFALVLSLLAVMTSTAQEGTAVVEGEVFTLGVIGVPGEIYEWNVYTDHTLLIQAVPPDVVLTGGNTGAAVQVLWAKKGTYYYTVTAYNFQGCMNLKVGMITVSELKLGPAIAITVNRNPVCIGTRVVYLATVKDPGKDPVYQWYKNGIKVGLNMPTYIDFHPENNDEIYCELLSRPVKVGPISVESNMITMTVYEVKAGFSIVENVGGIKGRTRFVNKSSGADFYNWRFGNGQSSEEENPVVTYDEDGIYPIRLTATNYINCVDTCSKDFNMLFKGLFIPNGFAPTVTNELGGQFKPVGVNLKYYRIEVYDNWGHMLWASTALDENGRPVESWDGTYEGKLLPQGTYMWKVHAVFMDNTIWQGSDIGKGEGKTIGTVTILK